MAIDLSVERLAVTAARAELEAALRQLRTAEAHADFRREPDGSIQLPDQGLNPDLFVEMSALQPALDAGAAVVAAAQQKLAEAEATYVRLAGNLPLFKGDNNDPVLLLPVRMEALYADTDEGPALHIRVYPDDVHVDSHEPELTQREHDAGVAYWRAVRAHDADDDTRAAAWQALDAAIPGPRSAWVREVLRPTNAPPDRPIFPKVELRPEAWTRAAHTLLLPHHFEFSAYRDGALVWRRDGAPITPDALAIGLAPQAGAGEADPDALAFDDASRWLVDYVLAVDCGMAFTSPLEDSDERFDLLTVVGVGAEDAATGAQRVQDMLRAHAYTGGLAPLPVRTPTNNTPGTRSGWRSRSGPPDPDTVDDRRAAYDDRSDQEAARLARALGIDGAPVLAAFCDPAGGDEALLRRLQALQATYYSWSRALRPAAQLGDPQMPSTEPWFEGVAGHYERFVRARGPLPPLRIGRQPYGLLPITATDLWGPGGDDIDTTMVSFVTSFFAAFAAHADRAVQIGESPDQDAAMLDLLSREASPRDVIENFNFMTGAHDNGPPPPSAVGAIPASAALAWLSVDGELAPEDPGQDSSRRIVPFPDDVAEPLRQIVVEHPLAQLLVLFDETLEHMRATMTPPNPREFGALYGPLSERLAQLLAVPTRSLFYAQAEWAWNWLNNVLSSGPALPEEVVKRIEEGTRARDLFALYVDFEDDASPDVAAFERVFRETLEPLSHRVDAWVSSLATARLAALREQQPAGVRTGAYGWLLAVERDDPNPSREGYVTTPSLHHATTAAVLRSGWQAHTDRRAFAVDIQSARVRRAQAMIEGVRAGQTVGALLGYQFERALHDAQLDRCIAGFRTRYPLAPLVEPDVPDADAARVAIGARNVVDGQALRLDRPRLADDAALGAAAATALDGDATVAVRRMLGELDETFDAVGDLLLAESVHHLVGGNALRAGLAADAVGRGQDLPADYDVLRTPRGGIGVTHHVGVLLGDKPGAGWPDDRPLVLLAPGLEAWVRHRLGPAKSWSLGDGAKLADLGWCALELLIAPAERVRAALTAGGGTLDEPAFTRLMLLCERLRAALATAVPLTPMHLDPAEPAPATGYDDAALHDRVGAWLDDVRDAAKDLLAAKTPAANEKVLERLGALGLPIGLAGPDDADRLRALLGPADLAKPPKPPDAADDPTGADAWRARLLATTTALLHPTVKVAPPLTRPLPPAPKPEPDDDTVAAWLQDMALVRPKVDALDGACVAAEVVAGTAPATTVVAQAIVAADGAGPWIGIAAPAEGPRPRAALVLHRDGAASAPVCGLVVDSWTEVVPRAPGEHGPEEVVGVAFDFDRPGARSPQALLLAVPPHPERGWCMEDLHGCLDEALLLARVRTLDLVDLPELRSVLPIPDPQG